MHKVSDGHIASKLFTFVGALGIISGGLLSAFSARQPTEFAMWASAYLVLVVGVLGIGFGVGLWKLMLRTQSITALLSFLFYTLSNVAVIVGTAFKSDPMAHTLLVDGGGIGLVVAMVLLLCAVHGARRSWQLSAFYALVIIVLVSMPIGLLLSR